MALLIHPSDPTARLVRPADGAHWTYEELLGIVGGTVNFIQVDNDLMYFNDNFIAEKLFYNMLATELARRAGLPVDEWIAGTVIIVPTHEDQLVDD